MIQICSGIASGKVLNGELYAQSLQELIYSDKLIMQIKLTSVVFVLYFIS